MAKYMPTVDLWDPQTRAKLDAGEIHLQPGQWVRCGDSPHLSRLHYVAPNGRFIRAFHGPEATRKFRQYIAACRAADARRAVRQA